MRTSELVKLLKKHGCYQVREGSRHEIWYSPITGKEFQVGRHQSEEVKTGTANRILKDAGLK